MTRTGNPGGGMSPSLPAGCTAPAKGSPRNPVNNLNHRLEQRFAVRACVPERSKASLAKTLWVQKGLTGTKLC